MTASGLMTIPEAAEYMGVSTTTIRVYIDHGLIAPTNLGTGHRRATWMIQKKELDRFINERSKKQEYIWLEPAQLAKKKPMKWFGESALTPDGRIPRRKPKPAEAKVAK